jgi:hypothetical protein
MEEQEAWERATKETSTQLARLRRGLKQAEGERRRRIEAEIAELDNSLPSHLATIPTVEDGERTDIHVLKRGDWERKGEAVGPRVLGALLPDDAPELDPAMKNPRVRLAQWLTDPANPLTARVIVNRIWQGHFGQGLVNTPNDFGANGDRPSHPALLDWLASELVEGGWRLKRIHRLILLSNAYRQASVSPRAAEFAPRDPDNRLLWRFSRRRLTAEEIRDAMLSVSGRLNLKAGGPSVMIPVDPELVGLLYKPSQWEVTEPAREHDRRSIYLIAKRNLRLPFMEVFDQPTALTSCARRESSTHAPQALELLNGKLANYMAAALAGRLRAEAADEPSARVRLAYRLATGRLPTERESDLATAFLRGQPLEEFALAVLNLNDFLYVH